MIINERDQNIVAWQVAEAALAKAKTTEMELRTKVFGDCFPTPEIGTNNLDLGKGYKLKAVNKLNYNLANGEGETEAALDAIAALGNEGAFIAERLVGWKPSLSLTEYKKLEATNPTHAKVKALIDAVLTTTPATPTLEVIEPKAK